MAITTSTELQEKALQLVPAGKKITESAVRVIHREIVEGGSLLSLEEISVALRNAYTDPFITVKFLEEQIKKYNINYEN